MRSSHAVSVLALVSAATVVALLLTESGINGNWADFKHVAMSRWRFFALFAVIFAVGGWWTARTWRQLWRAGRSQWERIVYDSGVRGFGFGTAMAVTAIIAWLGWATDSDGPFGPIMTLGLLAGIFFATLTGVEHDHHVEVGEPPHLT